MNKERSALLDKNPRLNATTRPRAWWIFDCISQWGYQEYFTDDFVTLHQALVYPRKINGGAPPKLLDRLDQDIFFKIIICAETAMSVQQLLDDAELFEQFLVLARQSRVDTIPAKVNTPEPIGLKFCEIIEFKVNVHLDMMNDMQDKTFGGILFKWRSSGSKDLFGDKWEHSQEPYRCPKHLMDSYVQALNEAIFQRHQKFDDLLDHIDGGKSKLYFGPMIKVLSRKQGFFLAGSDPKIYYPKEVPWSELAEKGIVVEK